MGMTLLFVSYILLNNLKMILETKQRSYFDLNILNKVIQHYIHIIFVDLYDSIHLASTI